MGDIVIAILSGKELKESDLLSSIIYNGKGSSLTSLFVNTLREITKSECDLY